MANNIKGITIEIGGDTGPLSSALKDVNKTAGDLQSELKEVNKQLKFDPQSAVLSKQKIDLLKQSAQALEEKQRTLKTAVEQAHAAFEKGELGADKVRAVEREYEKVNSQLKDTKKALNEAERETGTFSEKVKARFSGLKDKIKDTFSAENIKAGIGAVGVAVGTFLKSSLDKAKDAQKANADLEQTLKSTKGAAGMTMQSLNDLTQAMVNNTDFTGGEVKAGEAMLLTFTNIGKDVFPQATSALLDMSQKMGTDAKTQAIQLGKALNDPVKGITALTRVGVTFSAQQKEQIAQMVKVGDVAGAQKLILAELNKEFGGQAAAAADTYAGKQKQLQNQLNSVKSAIGTALIPALAAILKTVAPIIQAIANFVSKNPQLTAAILAVIAVVSTLIGGLSLLTTVTGAFGIALDVALLPTIGLVVLAIAAIVAAAVAIVTHWSQISAFFVNLWNSIKNAFSGVGDWFKNTFDGAMNSVQGAFSSAPGFFSSLGSKISGALNTTGGFIKNNWKSLAIGIVNPIAGATTLLYKYNPGFKVWADNMMNSIKSAFTSAWNSIVAFFTQSIPKFIGSVGQWFQQLPYNIGYALGTAIAGIINFGVSAWNWVTTQLPQIINGIIQWFAQLPGKLWALWMQIVLGIGNWIISMGQKITTEIPILINAIVTFFSQLPGKIWTFLADIITKIGAWITSMASKIATKIPELINTVATFFGQLPGKIWAFLSDVVNKVVTWCGNLVSTATTEIPKFVSTVVSFISELPGKMLDIGKNIVTGIWDGINGAVSWLHDRISSFCSGIVDGFKSKLKIHSPSQLFADVIGKNLALGIGQGFTENMKAVIASMTSVIPTSFNTGVEVSTAMAAAYGGYSVPVSTSKTISSGNTESSSSGIRDITVRQYFQGKVPTPAENARLTRNGLQQVILKLRK